MLQVTVAHKTHYLTNELYVCVISLWLQSNPFWHTVPNTLTHTRVLQPLLLITHQLAAFAPTLSVRHEEGEEAEDETEEGTEREVRSLQKCDCVSGASKHIASHKR